MITFIAHFTVVPENAAAFEELLDHVVTMSNAEPGVVYYGVAQSVEDATKYSVVEVYRDHEDVAAHGQTEWVVKSVPAIPESHRRTTADRTVRQPRHCTGRCAVRRPVVSTEGLAIVRRFSQALGDRDLTKVKSLLHRDLVAHTAGGLPYSGDYYGPQGFLDLFAAMTQAMDLTPGPLNQQPLDEQTVVSRFRLRFVARASGKSAEMDLVEIYRVSDGLIVDLDVYYKDPSAVAAVLA